MLFRSHGWVARGARPGNRLASSEALGQVRLVVIAPVAVPSRNSRLGSHGTPRRSLFPGSCVATLRHRGTTAFAIRGHRDRRKVKSSTSALRRRRGCMRRLVEPCERLCKRHVGDRGLVVGPRCPAASEAIKGCMSGNSRFRNSESFGAICSRANGKLWLLVVALALPGILLGQVASVEFEDSYAVYGPDIFLP